MEFSLRAALYPSELEREPGSHVFKEASTSISPPCPSTGPPPLADLISRVAPHLPVAERMAYLAEAYEQAWAREAGAVRGAHCKELALVTANADERVAEAEASSAEKEGELQRQRDRLERRDAELAHLRAVRVAQRRQQRRARQELRLQAARARREARAARAAAADLQSEVGRLHGELADAHAQLRQAEAAAAPAHAATPSLPARTLSQLAFGAAGAVAGVCQGLLRVPGLLLSPGH